MCLREGAPFDSSFVLSTSRGENDHDSERIISFKADFHEKCGFIAIVSDDGVVLNSADQQPVWFGMHQLSEEYMDKEVAAFSVKECDEVFSRWESGPLKNHTFEDVLIASENGNQLFSSMSLGDVVLYLVLNESSDVERVSLPMAVNSIA